MEKDFKLWCPLKEKINSKEKRPIFHEREIWWCNIGTNIGYEQDGKGKTLTRPVLVIKKFHSKLFYGLTLSTKLKPENPYYFQINFLGNIQSVILQQARSFDSKRLVNRMGRLPEKDFDEIKKNFVYKIFGLQK